MLGWLWSLFICVVVWSKLHRWNVWTLMESIHSTSPQNEVLNHKYEIRSIWILTKASFRCSNVCSTCNIFRRIARHRRQFDAFSSISGTEQRYDNTSPFILSIFQLREFNKLVASAAGSREPRPATYLSPNDSEMRDICDYDNSYSKGLSYWNLQLVVSAANLNSCLIVFSLWSRWTVCQNREQSKIRNLNSRKWVHEIEDIDLSSTQDIDSKNICRPTYRRFVDCPEGLIIGLADEKSARNVAILLPICDTVAHVDRAGAFVRVKVKLSATVTIT